MAPRTDDRLLDAPMEPLRCRRCDAAVRVRKSSWQQTSIQWDGAAMAACQNRRSATTARTGRDSDDPGTCPALRESIQQAAVAGSIQVPDDHH